MANHADTAYELDSLSNASTLGPRRWSKWPEMSVGVKRSISWDGLTAIRKHRTAIPDLSDDGEIAIERNLSPFFSSPSIESRAGSGSINSESSPHSFHDDQSIASFITRARSVNSQQSIDIFADNDDAFSFLSPSSRSIISRVEVRTSQRSVDLFSSMDVAFDTQSVDLFSDCESNVGFIEQRTISPDIFDDSSDEEQSVSRPESVADSLENHDIIDLTQEDYEAPEQSQNEPVESGEENVTDLLGSPTPPDDIQDVVGRSVAAENVPPTQLQVVQNSSQQHQSVDAPAAETGNSHGTTSQHLQLAAAEKHLNVLSGPNFLLERLLGSRFASDILAVAAPAQENSKDDMETVFSGDDPVAPEIGDEAREILRKIECLIEDTLTKLSEGKRLELTVRSRADWSNCVFEDDVFTLLPLNQAKSRRIRSTYWLSLIFYLLAEIYEMISLKRTCTTRELYYSDTQITEKQENVNEALKLICSKLEVTPWQLGVMSSAKGLLAGNLKIHMPESVVIDCSLHIDGILLPHCTSAIERLTTDAKYVLLVEKDTVFKKLVQYNISKHFGTECILITGKGYPDTNTRLMLKKLWDSHKLPIYALTDADPHGIEIMLTYRHGSLAMSNLSDSLAVPSIRWIGVLPSDIQKFGIKSIPMTGEDRRKLDSLLKRPGLNDNVYRELEYLKRTDKKAEIEGLSGSSSHYLIDVYLRDRFDNKIAI